MSSKHDAYYEAQQRVLADKRLRESARQGAAFESVVQKAESLIGTPQASQITANDARLVNFGFDYKVDREAFRQMQQYSVPAMDDPFITPAGYTAGDLRRWQSLQALSPSEWQRIGLNPNDYMRGFQSVNIEDYLTVQEARLNSYIRDARTAALAGDMAKANGLAARAEGLRRSFGSFSSQMFSIVANADIAARAQIGSPTGQLVSSLITSAGNLANPNSKEYSTAFHNLTDPAIESLRRSSEFSVRSLVGQTRNLEGLLQEAAIRDVGDARALGAERTRETLARRALDKAITDEQTTLSSQESDFLSQATTFLQGFSSKLSTDTLALGKEFARNNAFGRSLFFNAAEENAQTAGIRNSLAVGDLLADERAAAEQRKELRTSANMEAGLGAVSSIIGTALTQPRR